MKEIELETSRISLQKITPNLIHKLFDTLKKNEIMLILGLDETGYERYEKKHLQGMETDRISMLYFLIINKENNKVIGECGFNTWNQSHKRAEVFYSLSNEADRGKGYLTEVLPVILNFGFEKMELHRIEAFVANWNTPSIKLLLRNNFIKEGTMREHYFIKGKYENSDCYSLLKKEFKQ